MAGVAHTPYLEKRPSGLFFRRRIPSRLTEIPDPIHGSFLCLPVRTDLLPDARAIVRGLTALTDLAFALMTERRDMRHLAAENIRLLEALARFQVEAHDAARAMAEPRTLEAAHLAAECERATQKVLRSAIACGDREIAREPLRTIGEILGVALPDENTESGRALAFEALRVLLDVSHARERAEIGQFQEATPIFHSAMARRTTGVRSMPELASTGDIPIAPIALPVPPASAIQPANTANGEASWTDATTNVGDILAANVGKTAAAPAVALGSGPIDLLEALRRA